VDDEGFFSCIQLQIITIKHHDAVTELKKNFLFTGREEG